MSTTFTVKKRSRSATELDNPLCEILLALDGVSSVMFGHDFITVIKDADASWDALEARITSAITPFAAQAAQDGTAMIEAEAKQSWSAQLDYQDAVVQQVAALLEERVRPNVLADGGDVQLRGFDKATGVVWVSMVGSCATCASSTVTVRFMIRNLLTHYVPEVRDVRAMDEDAELGTDLD